jgi:polyhydroxyalkanoate synthase
MTTQTDNPSVVARLVRETERTAIRARHGLRYLTGGEWAPPRPTPSDVVWRQGTAELWRYRSDHVRYAEPVVAFIGLVSRSYILDLHRKNSLARRLRDAGLDVYLLDWGTPTAGDSQNTLETYVLRYLPRALRAALDESSAERASLLGYCMGGNFALLALAAQRLPVTSLVTMATPVDFAALGGLAGAIRDRDVDIETITDWTGNVPPEYLSAFFRARKPTADIPNLARLWENLWNDEFVEAHQAMARWAREHVPFPGAAFRQVADQWLQQNGFMTGCLRLAGRRVDLKAVRCPTFSIIALRDDLVPPEAARPIGEIIGADEFELLELDAGHAGLTTSRKAATTTMPAVQEWLTNHNQPKEA